jgi:hypothetical protein
MNVNKTLKLAPVVFITVFPELKIEKRTIEQRTFELISFNIY